MREKRWRFVIILFLAIPLLIAFFMLFRSTTNEADTLFSQDSYVYEKTNNLSRNRFIDAISLGGEWFLNNQNDDFIYYEYVPKTNSHSSNHNELREMGSLWAITKLGTFLDDSRYKNLSNKGFDYYEKYFAYDHENDFYFVNITPGNTRLGYSAFIVLTLLGMDHPKKEFYLEKFVNGIIYHQNGDGSFDTFFEDNRSGEQDYYPGEALLALGHYYKHKHDGKVISVMEKALPYYRNYWKNNKNKAFIPWQTQAYYDYFLMTSSQEAKDFVFEMNDFMVNEHHPSNKCSKFGTLFGIVEPVYLEGMNQAYALARNVGDKKRVQCYGNYIHEIANYTLTMQITDNEKFQKEALGGFFVDTNTYAMRVDRNQHAVMALMGGYILGVLD